VAQDVANAAQHLASDEANFITGVVSKSMWSGAFELNAEHRNHSASFAAFSGDIHSVHVAPEENT